MGKEVGDLMNYGLRELRSKDLQRMKAYTMNLLFDMVAGVCGLLIGALLT